MPRGDGTGRFGYGPMRAWVWILRRYGRPGYMQGDVVLNGYGRDLPALWVEPIMKEKL